MTLSDDELERYARHIVLKEIGGAGQARLKTSTVVVIGAGGIGCPAIQYLAAAGVGRVRIVDFDRVELSNLQRQFLFTPAGVGGFKAEIAAEVMQKFAPSACFDPLVQTFDPASASYILENADVVVDGCDNFQTRLAVADACLAARIPLISAAVSQFEGQLAVYRGWEPDKPCYRCFVGNDPAREGASCADEGVLGAMAGVIGSLAALEAIRALTPFGDDPAGKLLLADALSLRFRTIGLPKDPGCLACAKP